MTTALYLKLLQNSFAFHTGVQEFSNVPELFRANEQKNRIAYVVQNGHANHEEIVLMAQNTGPFVHSRLSRYIQVDRLLTGRPAVFYNDNDHFLALQGKKRATGFGMDELENWTNDDAILAQYIQVCSATLFVTDCGRFNAAASLREPDKYFGSAWQYEAYNDQSKQPIKHGYIVGCIGARFEKKEKMDTKYWFVSAAHTTVYGYVDKQHDTPTKTNRECVLMAKFLLDEQEQGWGFPL